MDPEVFHTDAQVRDYYDSRYRQGYMDIWDPRKVALIRDIFRCTEMPARARVLDYGCGTGFLSRLLKELFPGWEIVGPTSVRAPSRLLGSAAVG